MTAKPPMHGIVLLAHGSRDPLWCKPVEAVAQQLELSQTGAIVACAYLELCAPKLADAVSKLVQQGVQTISVVPLFLGIGKHAREDLPKLISSLRLQYPATSMTLQAPVGENPRLIALLADIALEGITTGRNHQTTS